MEGGPFRMTVEPALPEVDVGDRILVRNVLYVATALNKQSTFFNKWVVNTSPTHYMLELFLTEDFSISGVDINVLKDINITRIGSIVVRKDLMAIQILRADQSILLYETDIVRVVKKARRLGMF
jgi:hypothetical protein